MRLQHHSAVHRPGESSLTQRRTTPTSGTPNSTSSSFFCKHAEVFSRGFLDFEGSQRQGEREQPTFIPVCRAYAAPPARDAGLLPLQESRVAVLLSSLHGRVPAPSIPTDAPAPQGGFSTLRLTVLSLGPVEATLITQRREPQPRTGDIPSRVLGP